MFLIQSKKICSFNSFNINLLNSDFSKMVVGRFFLLLSSMSKNQFLIKFVETIKKCFFSRTKKFYTKFGLKILRFHATKVYNEKAKRFNPNNRENIGSRSVSRTKKIWFCLRDDCLRLPRKKIPDGSSGRLIKIPTYYKIPCEFLMREAEQRGREVCEPVLWSLLASSAIGFRDDARERKLEEGREEGCSTLFCSRWMLAPHPPRTGKLANLSFA